MDAMLIETARKPEELGPGFHTDISSEEYRLIPAISQSALKCFLRSPAHAKEAIENPKPPTSAMRLGTLVHAGKLEPFVLLQRYCTEPDWANDPRNCTKKGEPSTSSNTDFVREQHAQFLGDNKGKEIISQGQLDAMQAMLKKLAAHRYAASAFTREGSEETTVIWKDSEFDIWCKARADALLLDKWPTICDLKTCGNAHEDEFTRAIVSFRYDIQAGYYVRGVVQAAKQSGEPLKERPNFLIVAVENTPPFEVNMFDMSEWLPIGNIEVNHLMRTLVKCRETGEWPGYPCEIHKPEPPKWIKQRYGQ